VLFLISLYAVLVHVSCIFMNQPVSQSVGISRSTYVMTQHKHLITE